MCPDLPFTLFLSLSSAKLIVFELQRRSNSSKNELSLRSDFLVPSYFFFEITKRGRYRLWTYLTLLLKRGRESLLQKNGESGKTKGILIGKIKLSGVYLIWFCAPFKLNLSWAKLKKKEFELDFAQILSALAASLVLRRVFDNFDNMVSLLPTRWSGGWKQKTTENILKYFRFFNR